jgi:hypothetical protein
MPPVWNFIYYNPHKSYSTELFTALERLLPGWPAQIYNAGEGLEGKQRVQLIQDFVADSAG